ncbi:hypothetical protein H1S01_10755 [Heliobacterium chlorum]|uniref:DarT domain-containing protein n=1 Tax=Heliobacterium chlorum TaxID=2698 RepID=A0ABR7T4R3_HELCL|nr:hypothetical protein [Heliobacterium chlorum]MBC9784988.1 hypothetical protein [Heliobacterium chlorum]
MDKIANVVKLFIGRYASLYHYTDIQNLESIQSSNTLISCNSVDPNLSKDRRSKPIETIYNEKTFIANDQLEIVNSMFADGITPHDFRKFLDRHVFFWLNKGDCLSMFGSYKRRIPQKKAAIIVFNAQTILSACWDSTKFCKYNSGSSPQNPSSCTYKKNFDIFLPANCLGTNRCPHVPTKVSEIKEVLVESKVMNLSDHVEKVFTESVDQIPRDWQDYYCPISNFGEV